MATTTTLSMCCAYAVAVQDNPIFKGKQLDCGSCGRKLVYSDSGIGWSCAATEHEQLAPEVEEWHVKPHESRFLIVLADTDWPIAEVYDKHAARVIVNDHRLAALVPGLEAALKESAMWFHATHRNIWGEAIENCGHEQCEAALVMLNAIAKESRKC